VIFNVTKGADPYGLVHYLLLKDPERVAWVGERNLMTMDPSDVVARMRAVMDLSSRVEHPVYHVSASWHPDDKPTYEQMSQVVDRVRDTLGFDAHQVFVVSHNDTDHPHIHMVFNRVSPETGKALNMSHDYKRLDQLGRALEQEHGWSNVRSPFADRSAGMDRAIPEYTNGEVHSRKDFELTTVGLRRDALTPVFEEARDWGDLEERLGREVFVLESTGRGLVITDGDIRTSASRIGRQFSYLNMADRFGQTYDAWRVDQGRVGDPLEQVIERLTSRQATFTDRDVAREVYKVTRSAEEHWKLRETVLDDPRLIQLGCDDEGRRRFASMEQLGAEYRVSQYTAALAEGPELPVVEQVANRILDGTGSTEQRIGLHSMIFGRGRISALGGLAGAGKSAVLGRATQVWSESGYTVVGASAYGKQADDLGQALGVDSRTLASWEASWALGRDLLTDRHVIAVDEAGLMDTRQAERLLGRVYQSGAKVVLVGDPPQLNPVGAGMPFRQIMQEIGAAVLRDVQRQRVDWQQSATVYLSEGRANQALDAYASHGMLHWHPDQAHARVSAATDWFKHRQSEPQEVGLMIAYSNADVRALNKAAREWMRQSGMLGEDSLVPSSYGRTALAAGDQIMFRRNDRRQEWVKIDGGQTNGVANGTMGTVTGVEGSKVAVQLGDGRVAAFDAQEYRKFHHAYAITAHKAQGVTVDRTFAVVTKGYDRSLGYVSFSRHRDGVDAYIDQDGFPDQKSLVEAFSKATPATNALDFIDRAAARHMLPQSVLELATPFQPDLARRRMVGDMNRVAEMTAKVDPMVRQVASLGVGWQSAAHYLTSLASEPPSYGMPFQVMLAGRARRGVSTDRGAFDREQPGRGPTERPDGARHDRGMDRGLDRDGYEMDW